MRAMTVPTFLLLLQQKREKKREEDRIASMQEAAGVVLTTVGGSLCRILVWWFLYSCGGCSLFSGRGRFVLFKSFGSMASYFSLIGAVVVWIFFLSLDLFFLSCRLCGFIVRELLAC